jgi:dehydrogenase/reductase SDR family protein 12
MPSFRQRMINKLRTEEQGADTLVWMCCYNDLEKEEKAAFFQDRKPASKHLPLSWTQNTAEEEAILMKKLDEYYDKFSSPK